jgi:general secretion pathway protein L
MATRLLLRLPGTGSERAAWAPLGAAGSLAGAPEEGPLTALAETYRGAHAVVLVPGEDVLLTEASLPIRQRQRLLKALPYALEDQLAEDVETLHLAIGPASAGHVPVAVVSRARLEVSLEALRAAGVEPERMLPETLALPFTQGEWRVLVEGERALVRTDAHAGFAADRVNLAPLLRSALEEREEGRRPARVVLGGDDPQAAAEVRAAIADLTELAEPPEAEPALALFARGLAASPAIELLQGTYDRRTSVGAWLRPWRAAAGVALAWLLLEGGLQVADYRRLQTERRELSEDVEAVFREALPDAQRMVNPRVQLERALTALRPAGATGEGFLALLAGAGEVLREQPGARLRGVGYRAGRLDLDLEVPDLQALDHMKQEIASRSALQVNVQSVTAQEGRVQGRLQVSRAGT